MRAHSFFLAVGVPLVSAAGSTAINLSFDPDFSISPADLIRSIRLRFDLPIPVGLKLDVGVIDINLRQRDEPAGWSSRAQRRGLLGGVGTLLGGVVGGVDTLLGGVISVIGGQTVTVSFAATVGAPTTATATRTTTSPSSPTSQPSTWGKASLAATNDNHDNAWSAQIGYGTPVQSIKCTIDSGSSSPVVYHPSCSSCALSNHTAFQTSRSSTFSSSGSVKWNETFNDGTTVSGVTGKDTISFGSSLAVNAQPIGLVTEQTGFSASSASSCIFGFGRDAVQAFSSGSSLTAFSTLVKQKALAEPVLGAALVDTNKVTGAKGGGSFTLGSIDSSLIAGDIVYAQAASSNFWGVLVDDITVRGGKSVVGSDDPKRAILDTATTLILTSDLTAEAIHAQIPSAKYYESTETWGVPCNSAALAATAPPVFWHIGGSSFGVPASDLAFQGSVIGDGMCVSGVQGGSPDFTVLGDVFLANHYLVLKYDGGDLNNALVGLANRTDVGPIV